MGIAYIQTHPGFPTLEFGVSKNPSNNSRKSRKLRKLSTSTISDDELNMKEIKRQILLKSQALKIILIQVK
nr:6102_t:CDS:2 [Entrophospora candida]